MRNRCQQRDVDLSASGAVQRYERAGVTFLCC